MLSNEEINNKFIEMANSVKAEKLYDMDFSSDPTEFFPLAFLSKRRDQAKLVFNLYTNHIHNAAL